jgi:hypothetical protein
LKRPASPILREDHDILASDNLRRRHRQEFRACLGRVVLVEHPSTVDAFIVGLADRRRKGGRFPRASAIESTGDVHDPMPERMICGKPRHDTHPTRSENFAVSGLFKSNIMGIHTKLSAERPAWLMNSAQRVVHAEVQGPQSQFLILFNETHTRIHDSKDRDDDVGFIVPQ